MRGIIIQKKKVKSPSFLFRTSCPHLCHLQQQPFRHTRPMNTLYNLYTDLLFCAHSRSLLDNLLRFEDFIKEDNTKDGKKPINQVKSVKDFMQIGEDYIHSFINEHEPDHEPDEEE